MVVSYATVSYHALGDLSLERWHSERLGIQTKDRAIPQMERTRYLYGGALIFIHNRTALWRAQRGLMGNGAIGNAL